MVVLTFGQTTITYNPALYESGVVYISRTIEDIEWDYGEEGYNTWNVTGLDTGTDQDFEVVPYSSSLPDIDQCAMIPNYIAYYYSTTDTSEIEGWGYFHVNSSRQIGLGLSGTMETTSSSYFLNAFNTVTDPSIEFPTEYGDTWVEITEGEGQIGMGSITLSYEMWDTIWNEVDAWGVITTPLGTFDCLRIKKRSVKHSYRNSFIMGFDKWERQIKYAFITYELGLTATFAGPKDTLGGMPDSTFTVGKLDFQIDNTMLHIADESLPEQIGISVYPNPFNSTLHIGAPRDVICSIFDVNGKKIDEFKGSRVWSPNVSSGIYLIRFRDREGNSETKKISYIK